MCTSVRLPQQGCRTLPAPPAAPVEMSTGVKCSLPHVTLVKLWLCPCNERVRVGPCHSVTFPPMVSSLYCLPDGAVPVLALLLGFWVPFYGRKSVHFPLATSFLISVGVDERCVISRFCLFYCHNYCYLLYLVVPIIAFKL